MTVPIRQQRQELLEHLNRGFELTTTQAELLVKALRRGGPLAELMQQDIMVGHPGKTSRHTRLADELHDHLTRNGVHTVLVELMTRKLRPRFRYIRYFLFKDEIYGSLGIREDMP